MSGWGDGAPGPQRFYGKYRGRVWNNVDELGLGRLQVTVPAVPGLRMGWALPCTPYAGRGVGFYAMPPLDANVWVEFEGGDPNYPIWSGCFWEEGEVPGSPRVDPEIKIFQTTSISMVLNDLPGEGGFTLTARPPITGEPMSITINAAGITLSCPQSTVKMTPESISLTVPPGSQVITAETITLTVPESALSMSPERVEITCPPSTATWSAEALALGIPSSAITLAEEGIAMDAAALGVTAPVTIDPSLNVTGTMSLEGSVSVAGPVSVAEGPVSIIGFTSMGGGVAIEGDLSVEGAAEIMGALLVDGVPVPLPI